MSTLFEFPPRRFYAVRIIHDAGAWTVLAGPHGWAHGSKKSAIADAQWLARNLAIPVIYQPTIGDSYERTAR